MTALALADDRVDNYRLRLGAREYVPVVIGGMGVDISTTALALEAARLGGIGHLSDAMAAHVADRRFSTHYTKGKAARHRASRDSLDKTAVHFDLAELEAAQRALVSDAMERRRGDGAIFINVMEKLTMGAPADTLRVRLRAALDAGIDGVTLSAGLHTGSLRLVEDHPRFRDAKIGIIVSSVRALRIFLKGAARLDRLPDYVVVEGPLAGGHLGFGADWREHRLDAIIAEVLAFLRESGLEIPVIGAGGVFTGTDAVALLRSGAGAVQVATRFTVTRECGLPARAKQAYFAAEEADVFVSSVSATGYPLRLLRSSPCLGSNVKPQCEPFGYVLDRNGECPYLDAWAATPVGADGEKLPVADRICLCYHFSRFNCYTCGHYVYRLKDTSTVLPDGTWRLPTAEHVFRDYQFSRDHAISLPH